MRLLFEGGDYNIQGLAGGGYYSRAATIRGRRLIEEIRYVFFSMNEMHTLHEFPDEKFIH